MAIRIPDSDSEYPEESNQLDVRLLFMMKTQRYDAAWRRWRLCEDSSVRNLHKGTSGFFSSAPNGQVCDGAGDHGSCESLSLESLEGLKMARGPSNDRATQLIAFATGYPSS